ncbi:GP179 protein, partial [Tyrannus savana]|nr:GP179 protein [Tyrannus savana]
AKGLQGTSGPIQPQEYTQEKEQPPAKPTPSSPQPSTTSVQREAREKPRAEVFPPGSLGIPAGRAALLRQEAVASREDWAGTGEPPPRAAPGSSGAPEVPWRSSQVSVCPWEAVGAEGDAEVCPWERGTASSNAAKSGDGDISQGKSGIPPQAAAPGGVGEAALAAGKGSGQQGSPKSGEGEEQPGMGLPAVPKPSSQRAGSVDSKKATICPWEVEDEPRPKTEICPWEEAAAPAGKEALRQDTSKREGKPGSRGGEDSKAKLAERGGRQAQRR